MSERDDLRQVIADHFARKHPGTRWQVRLAGDGPVRLPPIEVIDAAVQALAATHDYVDASGQPAYGPGEFPAVGGET